MSVRVVLLMVLVFLLCCLAGPLAFGEGKKLLDAGPGKEPFDVTKHAVPLEEIQDGGPPKDGIPALDYPAFLSAEEARQFLSAEDRVLGVSMGGSAKAYPIKILNWHELVNDRISGTPLLVSW
jgi:hypothetical protein